MNHLGDDWIRRKVKNRALKLLISYHFTQSYGNGWLCVLSYVQAFRCFCKYLQINWKNWKLWWKKKRVVIYHSRFFTLGRICKRLITPHHPQYQFFFCFFSFLILMNIHTYYIICVYILQIYFLNSRKSIHDRLYNFSLSRN